MMIDVRFTRPCMKICMVELNRISYEDYCTSKRSFILSCIDGTTLFNTRKTVDSQIVIRENKAQARLPCASNIGSDLNSSLLRINEVCLPSLDTFFS